jgi:cysteine synthase B
VELWAKCEWLNPGGSVKDRTALSLVREGERGRRLRRGLTIIDSSSGNTAVGLALVGHARGYAVELVMPANASPGRRRLCQAYGARIVETDPLLGSDGALARVRELVAAAPERYFYADQYRNPANPLAHYRGTGPEVWEQTHGRVTHFVAGLGTSGTVMGAGRFLRQQSPRVTIVAVEPDDAFHGLEGLKHMATSVVPAIYDAAGHDLRVPVRTEDGVAAAEDALSRHGLLVGHSAGAALWAARRLAAGLDAGVVVALLPDGGERYLEGRT